MAKYIFEFYSDSPTSGVTSHKNSKIMHYLNQTTKPLSRQPSYTYHYRTNHSTTVQITSITTSTSLFIVKYMSITKLYISYIHTHKSTLKQWYEYLLYNILRTCITYITDYSSTVYAYTRLRVQSTSILYNSINKRIEI